ncbi:MAG TPA: hypothetical protein VNA13_00735 [Xanthomonadales bacterium]|nr:hypothetical protein [Xanthomonadales bacterium]
MDYLSLTLPGQQTINAPAGIPSGGLSTVTKVFRNSYTIMLIICLVLSLIFIVLGGIQWITSGGDKTKLQAARSKITWAVIGLIISFVSFFIIGMIGYFFNVPLLSIN